MLLRLGAAVVVGAAVGLERELMGKEAGIRTDLMVAAGAAIFTMVGITLPYIIQVGNLADVVARNSGFLTVIGNIVVGIGFLGAGVILHEGNKVRSLTTAATVWVVAALGVLCGIGLFAFAFLSAIGLDVILFLTRKIGLKGQQGNGE
ncbi:MAG: MgtC/SapB family protein [Patescibacteria group bacterium]|nr:MgtC/SapB family protein [Patescibacteria group bacterium]